MRKVDIKHFRRALAYGGSLFCITVRIFYKAAFFSSLVIARLINSSEYRLYNLINNLIKVLHR